MDIEEKEIRLRVPKPLHRKLRIAAAERGLPLSALVRGILLDHADSTDSPRDRPNPPARRREPETVEAPATVVTPTPTKEALKKAGLTPASEVKKRAKPSAAADPSSPCTPRCRILVNAVSGKKFCHTHGRVVEGQPGLLGMPEV